MITDLKYYLSHYKGFLSKDICNKTILELESKEFAQHGFYNPVSDDVKNISGNKELDVTYDKTSTKDFIMKELWNGLKKYTGDLNFSWYGGWAGYSDIRFNRYNETRKMAEHCDHIHSLFEGKRKGIPILTILGMLNDDYEGGELVFFEDTKIKTKQGDLLIFPSNFLYPHRVEPITKGVRWSYVSWVW